MKAQLGKDSEELRGMREFIEEMKQGHKGMEDDIAEAKKIPDPEMREVSERNIEKM